MQRKPIGSFPNKIREFRQHTPRGERVTQYMLADALGINLSAFNALEQGRTRLTPEKAMILAPLLHCKPWELSEELEALVNYDESKPSAGKPARKKRKRG